MKRYKRLFAVLLVVFLVVTELPLPAGAAQPEVVLTIPKHSTATDSGYVVTLTLKNNSGFSAAQVELSYNSSAITCKQVKAGDMLGSFLVDTNPVATGNPTGAILSAASSKNITENGTLAQFIFSKPGSGKPNFQLAVCTLTAANGKKMNVKVAIDDKYNDTSTGGGSTGGGSTDGSGAIDTPPEDNPEEDETPAISFKDVTSNHWAKPFIDNAVKKGWFSGYPNGTFQPNNVMTRAEFVSALWNIAEKPTVGGGMGLTDVTVNSWYYKAVSWGYQNGYISGVSATSFDPDGSLTREQAVMILYNMAGRPKAANVITKYKDYRQVSDYAVDAMNWAVANEIISGTSATTLSPKESATRAQITVIMVDYMGDE